MTPRPVAGACDGSVNQDPDSDAHESSECDYHGSHLVSGSSELLESSSSVLSSLLVRYLLIPSHHIFQSTANINSSMLKDVKTHEEAEIVVCLLSDGEKYALQDTIKFHRTSMSFPQVLLAGVISLQIRWLHEHSWMVYCEVAEGAFCKVCPLFCKSREVQKSRTRQISSGGFAACQGVYV